MDEQLKKQFREIVDAMNKVRRLNPMLRAARKRANNYAVIGQKKTDKGHVSVFKKLKWDNNKYTGQALREIRAKQTEKALEGKTHFNDGTPINRERIVELW